MFVLLFLTLVQRNITLCYALHYVKLRYYIPACCECVLCCCACASHSRFLDDLDWQSSLMLRGLHTVRPQQEAVWQILPVMLLVHTRLTIYADVEKRFPWKQFDYITQHKWRHYLHQRQSRFQIILMELTHSWSKQCTPTFFFCLPFF